MNEHRKPISAPDDAARIGVWFIGARGSVATTAIVGALSVRQGLAPTTGLVTELPELSPDGLPSLSTMAFGGHDVTTRTLVSKAQALAADRVIPSALVAAVESDLAAVESDVRYGHAAEQASTTQTVERLAADIIDFGNRHALERIVVVDVASTQPPEAAPDALVSIDSKLPVGAVYALAAFAAGAPYVSFTPSPCLRLPVVVEAAERSGLPYAGCDGKTGETLLKSVLAPMFGVRNLALRSWASVNLLGGGDGATLADPATALSKTTTKRSGLDAIVGFPVPGPMHIDQVEELGEWKTAWEHVLFDGFLDTRMTMQITWQGCDSALAAPLILDLVRLTAAAHAAGRTGALTELAFFFKDPICGTEHRLAEQWFDLVAWRQGLSG